MDTRTNHKTALRPVDFFDLTAAEYDRPRHGRFYRRIATELIARIPTSVHPASILEVGAGTGFATELLKNRFPRSTIVAFEPAPEMLKRGQRKVPRAKWVDQIDGTDVFDLAVSSMSYHWLCESEREKLIDLAAKGALALALPVTGGPALEGNKALRKLAHRLGAAAQWPRQVRRPASMRSCLEDHFSHVISYELNIHDEFENSRELADSLYARGVLFALFEDKAEKAKEMLTGQNARDIGFNWTIGLFIASSFRGQ